MNTKQNLQPNRRKTSLKAKKIGLIINPVAGMGGTVGLKGTDGKAILKQAKSLGALPVSEIRAKAFFSQLTSFRVDLELVLGAGNMGEYAATSFNFSFSVLGKRKKETSAADTKSIARRMIDAGVVLLVFCGGDGTARDILNAVGKSLPVVGVPTGVKMHSAVFACNPKAAARVVTRFLYKGLPLCEAEVMDIDEKAFRKGYVSAELYGCLLVPYEPNLIQANKLSSPITQSELRNHAAISLYVVEKMKPDFMYIIGPGTTTRAIGDLLELKKTLLGVDLYCNNKIVKNDVNEKEILTAIKGKRVKIIVTPIGGQGFIFGRGNQQISWKVIRKVGLENIIVIATESKLSGLKALRVDTGDPLLDAAFKERKMKVIADYKKEYEMQVE